MRIPWMACAAVWISAGIAEAQLVSEEIQLQSGWNAVWFNVAPQPSEIVDFLATQPPPLDCQAVWTFEPTPGAALDPAVGGPGRWLVYDRDTPPALRTLRTLQGHRAYFIKVNVGGTLQLSGEPVIRPFSFSGRISNLFGAMSDPLGGPLTFEEFFAHPSAAGKIVSGGAPLKHDIFSMSGGQLVRRTITDPIALNAAYWIKVGQDFSYAGPLDVTSSANGASFGSSTAIQTLSIDVPSSPAGRTVSVQARPCVELDGGDCAVAAAGVEWLEYRDPAAFPIPEWHPLFIGLDVLVAPGVTKITLDLRAKRSTPAATATAGGEPILPPLVIDVTDDQGARAVVTASVEVQPVFGLWAGRAELTRVSAHPTVQDIPLDQAAAAPLGMTLILDLPSPSEVAGGAVAALLDTVTIQTFRDGRTLQRRLSSVLFDRPVTMVVDGADPLDALGASGTLRATLHLAPDDPLNPYRHRYNPEHRRGYDITRDITIKLEPQAESISDQLSGLDGTFGPHRLTGQYTEVITGMTEQAITVQGKFRMERIDAGAE